MAGGVKVCRVFDSIEPEAQPRAEGRAEGKGSKGFEFVRGSEGEGKGGVWV